MLSSKPPQYRIHSPFRNWTGRQCVARGPVRRPGSSLPRVYCMCALVSNSGRPTGKTSAAHSRSFRSSGRPPPRSGWQRGPACGSPQFRRPSSRSSCGADRAWPGAVSDRFAPTLIAPRPSIATSRARRRTRTMYGDKWKCSFKFNAIIGGNKLKLLNICAYTMCIWMR